MMDKTAARPQARKAGQHRRLPVLPADTMDLLERRAKANGLSMEVYVEQVLKQGLFLAPDTYTWVLGQRDPAKHVDAAGSAEELLRNFRGQITKRGVGRIGG